MYSQIHSHQQENLISLRIWFFKYIKNKVRCIKALSFYNSVAFIKKHFKIGIWWIVFILQNKTRKFKKYLQNKFSFVMISWKCISTFRTSLKQQPPFHQCCPCLEYPNSSIAFLNQFLIFNYPLHLQSTYLKQHLHIFSKYRD